MPRGGPDYGMYAVKSVGAGLADIGELAARLGSIVTYDRRGTIVDFDDFEGPVLRIGTGITHVDDYVRHDSLHVKSGSQSLKLHAADSGGAKPTTATYRAVTGNLRTGFEISFSNLSTTCDLQGHIISYTGTERITAEFTIDPTNLELKLLIGSGLYQKIADLYTFKIAEHAFETIKMVVDFNTRYHVRLLLGPTEYDISTIPLWAYAATAAPTLRAGFYLPTHDSVGGDVWLDDFILTQEEP